MIGYDPDTHYARIGDTTQVFLDDRMINWVKNIKRSNHQAIPHEANPIIKKDKPWEHMPYFTTTYNVIRDADGGFKCWYSDFLLQLPRLNGRLCYATSEDGVHFEKAPMGQIQIDGHDTNMLSWKEDMDIGVAFCVIQDPIETDPAKRLKMTYLPVKKNGNIPKLSTIGNPDEMGLALAYSGDGVDWTPYPGNPVETVWGSDVQMLRYDEERERYVIYGRCHYAAESGNPKSDQWFTRYYPDQPYGWIPKRSVYMIESEDLIHWTPARRVLAPGPHHNLDDQFYGLPTFRLGEYYCGLLPVMHGVDNTMDSELVYSSDGIEWNHFPSSPPLIERGGEGSWDELMITTAVPPIRVGDEVYIYYGGSASHHDWIFMGKNQGLDTPEGEEGYIARHGMGLARIRADGFVSLDAGLREGAICTKPFFSRGAKLIVNAKCGTNGYIKAEIQDTFEVSWDGFTKDECDTFTGDEINHIFTWKGNSDVNTTRGYVRVCFYLKNAQLFSFRIADEV